VEHPTLSEVGQSVQGRFSLGSAKRSNEKVTQQEKDRRTNKESRKVPVRRVQLEKKDPRTKRRTCLPGWGWYLGPEETGPRNGGKQVPIYHCRKLCSVDIWWRVLLGGHAPRWTDSFVPRWLRYQRQQHCPETNTFSVL